MSVRLKSNETDYSATMKITTTKPWTDLLVTGCRARSAASCAPIPRCCPKGALGQARSLQTTSRRGTDGVFRGLTDGRLPTPWIEAFNKQQAGKETAAKETKPRERDLTPKRMSDSYHRVVLPLGQDPWLSDTYINSSGHIRCDHLQHPDPRRLSTRTSD